MGSEMNRNVALLFHPQMTLTFNLSTHSYREVYCPYLQSVIGHFDQQLDVFFFPNLGFVKINDGTLSFSLDGHAVNKTGCKLYSQKYFFPFLQNTLPLLLLAGLLLLILLLPRFVL